LKDVKAVLLGVVAVLLGVVTLPAVLFGGDGPDPLICAGKAAAGGDLTVILATIRAVETGGNYQTRISSATASGAYAFIDSSWRHYAALAGVDIARYPSAWMAPPADQDAAAGYYVNEILADHDDRIDVIPVAWYLPSAIDNDARMDVVPAVGANTLTPRQYQAKWMARYELERQRAALPPTGSTPTIDTTPGSQPAAPPRPGSCIGAATTPIGGDWALPGPRATLDANPAGINTPHHDYAAWDWIIPANTPIYAVRGGRVDRTTNWPYNWWSQGCGESGRPGCTSCGVGVTIVDAAGYRWTYCHGTSATVTLGDTVAAGQQVLWSGNTGRSGTAHLHLEIRTGGTRRCPQPLIQSLYRDGVGLDPLTLPTNGCSF